MFAHDLHVALALATALIIGIVVVEATIRVVTGRYPGRLAGGLSATLGIVVGMTAAAGLAMLARGERPTEMLHLVYAVFAFVLVPLGDSLTANATPRRRAVTRLVAGLVVAGIVVRLFGTG